MLISAGVHERPHVSVGPPTVNPPSGSPLAPSAPVLMLAVYDTSLSQLKLIFSERAQVPPERQASTLTSRPSIVASSGIEKAYPR